MAGLWLSHHHPEHSERCARLAGRLVCRRCLLLWPLCYALLALQVLARAPALHHADLLIPLLMWAPVLEFLEVHRGHRAYSAGRTWLLTPLLAVVVARLLYRCMVIPWDPVTWTVILVAGLPCAWAAWRFGTRSWPENITRHRSEGQDARVAGVRSQARRRKACFEHVEEAERERTADAANTGPQ